MEHEKRTLHARSWLRAVAIVAGVAAIGAATAEGQARRQGQLLAVGVGGGFDQVACEVCAGTPRSGLAGFLRFGGALNDRLVLAAELDGWTRTDEDTRQLLVALSAVVLLYADAEAGFHLRLGAGAVGFRASEDGEALTALTAGVSGGVGYDVPITESLSLTPFANLVLAPFADLDFNGDAAVGGATLGLLHGGLALTWH
ncbi:MAG: hypothetical protein R3266_06575 [Gemmatimonadota bacterium]|nr:hypothetical protein [Gemmatimonadota bacterium]